MLNAHELDQHDAHMTRHYTGGCWLGRHGDDWNTAQARAVINAAEAEAKRHAATPEGKAEEERRLARLALAREANAQAAAELHARMESANRQFEPVLDAAHEGWKVRRFEGAKS